MQDRSDAWRRDGLRVWCVPTMGFLHEGHLSLVRLARSEADIVVVTIFVNPLQFGADEDLSSYPRDFDRDVAELKALSVNAIYAPPREAVYPPGFATRVDVSGLTDGLCGASRPGHFEGVTTVLAKLFSAVRPHVAVFGQKDAQQVEVIRRMTRDLDLGVEIRRAPTVREPDGLALSSRNVYLTEAEREQAPVLFQALAAGKAKILGGERSTERVVDRIRSTIEGKPLARVDYVEVVPLETLKPETEVRFPALLAVAVYFGQARLIDNVIVNGSKAHPQA